MSILVKINIVAAGICCLPEVAFVSGGRPQDRRQGAELEDTTAITPLSAPGRRAFEV